MEPSKMMNDRGRHYSNREAYGIIERLEKGKVFDLVATEEDKETTKITIAKKNQKGTKRFIKKEKKTTKIVLHARIEGKKISRQNIIEILDIGFDCCDHAEDTDRHVTFTLMTVEHRIKDLVNLLMKHEAKIIAKSDLITHYLIEDECRILKTEYQLNRTPLRSCDLEVMEGKSSIWINWLISQGFDFDCKNKNQKSALELAFGYNLLHILPNLLKHTKLNCKSNIKLLHMFLERNVSDNHGPARIYSKSIDKSYAKDILKIFVDKGVAFDAVISRGKTALDLVIAAKEDHDLVKILLSGRNINDKKIYEKAFFKVLDVLTSHHDYFEATYYMQLLADLKDKGVDVNCKNEGTRPIQMAAARNNVRAIKFLVDNGADPKVTTKDGRNLLHLLVAKSNKYVLTQLAYEKLFDFLAASGVDQFEAANNLGDSPLHVAATSGNLAIVRKLIERGVNVDCRNILSKETPLHWAVGNHEAVDVVKYLLKRGANVNSKDGVSGRRALSWAAENPCNDEMFKVLLRGGAHVNARDRNGQTALYFMLKVKQPSETDWAHKVQRLIKYGADINDDCIVSLLPKLPLNGHLGAALKGQWFKLKAAGLPCSRAYEKFIARGYEQRKFYQQCSKEVEWLKSTRFDNRTSLYDWLHMDPNTRCVYVNNDSLKKMVENPWIKQQFTIYAPVILGNYREAVARKRLMQSVIHAWYGLTNFKLLDDCVELILGYLSNAELVDLIEDD